MQRSYVRPYFSLFSKSSQVVFTSCRVLKRVIVLLVQLTNLSSVTISKARDFVQLLPVQPCMSIHHQRNFIVRASDWLNSKSVRFLFPAISIYISVSMKYL